MANHKSAIKRAKQNETRRMRNKITKTQVKNAAKSVRRAVDEKNAEAAAQALKETTSVIDKAAKNGVIHKNTASRKISRLSRLVNAVAA